jgi:hypothetical protein
MTRFGEDIAWRFGHASLEPAPAEPRREARRLKAYASVVAKSGQHRASEDLESTVRTAS